MAFQVNISQDVLNGGFEHLMDSVEVTAIVGRDEHSLPTYSIIISVDDADIEDVAAAMPFVRSRADELTGENFVRWLFDAEEDERADR